MDNIAIHTARHPHETKEQHTTHHREYVHHMLDKLEEHNLYLKPEKCQFKKDEIEYLRVIIGKGHLQMSLKKLQGITDWSPPKNMTEVHSFLGLIWLPGFSFAYCSVSVLEFSRSRYCDRDVQCNIT